MKKQFLFVMLLSVLFSSQICAAPITFSFEGSGSGYVDDIEFIDSLIIIKIWSDSDRIRTTKNGYSTVNPKAEIYIENFGQCTFKAKKWIFLNTEKMAVGLSCPKGDLLSIRSTLFETFSLSNYIEPVTVKNRTASNNGCFNIII